MATTTAIQKMRAMLVQSTTLPFRPVLLSDPCVYCVVWPMPGRALDKRTIEHIQPRSEGGRNGWRNYAVAHNSCNGNRGSMPLLRFFLYRQRVGSDLVGKKHKRARLELRHRMLFPEGRI